MRTARQSMLLAAAVGLAAAAGLHAPALPDLTPTRQRRVSARFITPKIAPDIAAWNARIDQRKAEKRARKASRLH